VLEFGGRKMALTTRTSYDTVNEYVEMSGMCAGKVYSATFPTATQLTMQFGAGMSKDFLSWVSNSVEGGSAPKGSVVSTGYNSKVMFWDDWENGRVMQIDFPAVDAASKSSILIGLSVQLANVQYRPEQSGKNYVPLVRQKSALLACNFKFSIPGLTGATYIQKVDVVSIAGGGAKTSGPPVITVTIKESHAAGFRTWQQSASPMSGNLSYMTSDLRSSVFSLSLENLRVNSIVPAFPVNPADNVVVKLQPTSVQIKA